jgi:hypothetical protein
VLVSDKISTHRRFEKMHAELTQFARQNKEPGLNRVAQCAATFAENRLIHEELDYYQEEGEVLGKHPKLWEAALERDVKKLSALKSNRRLMTVRANISRDRKKLKKIKGEGRQKFEEKLKRLELEKRLLEDKLNA